MALQAGNTGSPTLLLDGYVGTPLANVETISSTRILSASDRYTQILTPSGAIRAARLPAVSIIGEEWAFTCPAASAFALRIESSNTSVIATLAPGESLRINALIAAPVDAADWSIQTVAGGSGVTTIGTVDSEALSSDGAVISGSFLTLQNATSTFPGLVSEEAQTLGGLKTLEDGLESNKNAAFQFGSYPKQTFLTKNRSGNLATSYAEESVSVWVPRYQTGTNNLTSVCWSAELGLFVAVASSGTDRVLTSRDGIEWTSVSVPSLPWVSVCWSPELSLFAAVAPGPTVGDVITSPDGVSWTTQTVPLTGEWRSICWSPETNLFVAVGIAGTPAARVMTSSDGISWNSPMTGLPNKEWSSVCWSPELNLFCAVASYDPAILGELAATSPDGETWTISTIPTSNHWHSITWSPELGKFCAVGDENVTDGAPEFLAATSSDGVSWSTHDVLNSSDWRSVCWSPELRLFVASAILGTGDRIMTSPDGSVWTLRASALDNDWFGVCWSPELGMFVCVSSNGSDNNVMSSSNLGKHQGHSEIAGKSNIGNGVMTPTDVLGLRLIDSVFESAVITYFIKRTMSGVVLVETGSILAVHDSSVPDWLITNTAAGASGVVFSITADGEIQYTSSVMTGSGYVGTMKWHIRPII